MPWLETVWFVLVGVLLAGYAILDGFDLGVGMLHLFVARRPTASGAMVFERDRPGLGRQRGLAAHRGGGALFAAFPHVYATVFSGFYLALMLRAGGAHPARGVDRVPDEGSRTSAGAGRGTASSRARRSPSLLLLGVAIGNVVRGLPLDADQRVRRHARSTC